MGAKELIQCIVHTYHPLDSFAITRRIDDVIWREFEVDYAYQHYKLGPAFSLYHPDGRVIGCGGIMIKRPGLGEGWILFDADMVRLMPRECFFYAKKSFEDLENQLQLERIEAYVKSDNLSYRKFVQRLGFEFEGRLRKWGPDGSDYNLYARIR